MSSKNAPTLELTKRRGELTDNLARPGHYGRALEDAISSHKSQWAPRWEGKNPLSGNKTFNTMDPTERVRVGLE